MEMRSAVLPFVVCGMLFSACSGGAGSASILSAPPQPSPGASPAVLPSSGWRLTTYYTPVLSFYSGAPQSVTGCPTLQCSNGTTDLGTFPADFVSHVHEEGTGKVGPNRYLNWSVNTGYWLDTLPRDAQGNALMPYRTAAADTSIPFGTMLQIQSCGADTLTGTPTAATTCASYTWQTWDVEDRFTVGTVGRHVDLYIGEQTSASFTSGSAFIDASGATLTALPPVLAASIRKPSPADSFQWILGAPLDISSPASVYDIDAFNTSASDVTTLHGQGRMAVCYINAGAYENFRPDAAAFPSVVVGNAYTGWPGENWLDIRRIDALGPIMQHRMDTCQSKGFDAIEPDNIDGFKNATGFPLAADDQVIYNTWLASMAHERRMAIALKNDDGQVPQLERLYDFALAEDCWQQGWCGNLRAFHADGKAVFTVEYTDVTTPTTFSATYCPQAQAAGLRAILKHRNLDAWIQTCP